MLDFFRNLPKITNNHVHIFAMYPYKKLMNIIQQNDPDLFNKIFIYVGDSINVPVGTMITINESKSGLEFRDETDRKQWIRLSDIYSTVQNIWTINKSTKDPFEIFEKIQTMFRIIVRHYKIYYYLWYSTLYANYINNVFYLNVKGKPGNINTDVKCGHRLCICAKHLMDYDLFIEKIRLISSTDRDIEESDYKYLYQQYSRMKCETDIIMKAVNIFNKKYSKPEFITDDEIFRPFSINFKEDFIPNPDNKPQMMVQYVITLSKTPIDNIIDIKKFTKNAKILLYAAVIINQEYNYPIFNGIDLVGNEQKSKNILDFIPFINKILYFRKFDINFIPHIGESTITRTEIEEIDHYLFDKNILRIGHGIALVSSPQILDYLIESDKILTIESCPISNYLLGYFNPRKNPHKDVINHPNVRVMICSDDNGVFNYSTVSRDYYFIYKYWSLTKSDFKKLITNGIYVIPKKYRKYYYDLFKYLWSKTDFSIIGLDKF